MPKAKVKVPDKTPEPPQPPQPIDPAALLLPRRMACRVLGGKSVATIKKLEKRGLLTPVRFDAANRACQVFYRRREVLALAGIEEG